MDWYWVMLVLGLIVSFVAGFILGARSLQSAMFQEKTELNRASGLDRSLLLHTLRRELANYLIQKDGQKFKSIYLDLIHEIKVINICRHMI